MEGIKDKWVRGRGGVEFVRKGGVNKGHKECIGEESDHFIVSIRSRNMVRLTRQGIWGREVLSGNIFKMEVKLREVKQPLGLAAVNIVGLSEVSQVFVVSEDLDWGR